MQKSRVLVVTGAGVAASATSALATVGSADLIDYASVATSLTGILQTAVGAAIGVGVLVLGARFGWRFFKSFTK